MRKLFVQQKIDYEKKHLVDWEKGKCCICNFPLEINAKGVDVPAKEMSYLDFNIRKEHKFLRKVLSKQQLKTSLVINVMPLMSHECYLSEDYQR